MVSLRRKAFRLSYPDNQHPCLSDARESGRVAVDVTHDASPKWGCRGWLWDMNLNWVVLHNCAVKLQEGVLCRLLNALAVYVQGPYPWMTAERTT